jgi:ATP-dependent helicase/nuclease subunit B
MPEAKRPHLYTLPFGQDLCDVTVAAIIQNIGDDPLALSKAIIFLPNNRAIRSMTEAFVRQASPGLLLPRMVAIGDLALDEALGALLDPLTSAHTVPPVIEPTQRLMLLVKLIIKHHEAAGTSVKATEALRLARQLADVIDELEIEQVRFGRFETIDPGPDLATHWESSYAHLMAIVPEYDAELRALNTLGPAARRNILLDNLVQSFLNNPPQDLIIAAGISTAAPAIAAVLKCIAMLPNSMVIFPAIDVQMEETHWEKLGPHDVIEGQSGQRASHETHPQFHLKLLLDRMGFNRDEVENIGGSENSKNQNITDIFCLAEETANWRDLPQSSKVLPHVRVITAEDSAEEARAIAVLAREALEKPYQRVAIITPDRELALRITEQLKRWNISIDDSAGSPLIQTVHGTLLTALAQGIADGFAPVSLLAIAKHPLVSMGDERLNWLGHARMLDMILRGPSKGLGLTAIGKTIGAWQLNAAKNNKDSDTEFLKWWGSFFQDLQPLDHDKPQFFSDILSNIGRTMDTLTKGVIWKGAVGRQLASFLEELARYDLTALGKVDREATLSLLTELMAKQVVRPAYGGHPRVAIYGLLEARLQQADVLICAGLNEGSWPQLPQPDPWLAPRIRRELNLAAPERNIGLSAHDLATALGGKQVYITRSKRDRSGPTVASRFLLRIKALLGESLMEEEYPLRLARILEAPTETIKYTKPAPIPTKGQRDIVLSVTDFDRLKADPYAFYASKILRLRTLEAVDAEPGPAWRGTVIHDILEAWAKEDNCNPDRLMERAQDLLSNPAVHPSLRALWQPRVAEALQWVAQQTEDMRHSGRLMLVAEEAGYTEIDGVKIKGRADRIDRTEDGTLAIVDYKTGSPPSAGQVIAGFALQLGLIGLIAEKGGIKGVSGDASAFEYWSLAKSPKGSFGFVRSPVADKQTKNKILADEFVSFALNEAQKAINLWINGTEPFFAKLHPEFAPFAEYDQLMRFEEWNGREPIEGEGHA